MSIKLKHPKVKYYQCDHAWNCKERSCGHIVPHKPYYHCNNYDGHYYCRFMERITLCRSIV